MKERPGNLYSSAGNRDTRERNFSSAESESKKPLEKLENLRQRIEGTLEVISGVPVFTLEDGNNEDLGKIVEYYGPKTVFRIINKYFVDDALEFGTDRARIDTFDFRAAAPKYGEDVMGVEEEGSKLGLMKQDVFCGLSHDYFVEEKSKDYKSGLGVPKDRTAILIFNSKLLEEIAIEGEDRFGTDGYRFIDRDNKKEALLGVVKFQEAPLEFENRLAQAETMEAKIELLKNEVWGNINTVEDLAKVPYIALQIINLLYQESTTQTEETVEESRLNIEKLKEISRRLKYEMYMIDDVDNMQDHLTITREAFAAKDESRMSHMKAWPDFVIRTVQSYLQNDNIDDKYRNKFLSIIADAHKCKEELGIG